ncbi:uncharacterized protein RJT21DRAFT_14675 [Scheffersomyces amazonensis]|uniref:uncharacterized protein n=1 Tax=Scheffersomyces amazonensis TaxID=1078765 RepID=UPI00315C9327
MSEPLKSSIEGERAKEGVGLGATTITQASSVSSVSSVSTLRNLPKTTVIINNLHKNDFIIDESSNNFYVKSNKSLSLVDQIKLSILNLGDEDGESNDANDYFINHIEHWSSMPFLSRIIIILKDEISALKIYNYLHKNLSKEYPYIKVSLQENLLSRSKSSDSLTHGNKESMNLSEDLSKFRSFHNSPNDSLNNYEEPKPYQFHVVQDLSKLGIDVSQYNNEEQLKELSDSETHVNFRPQLTRSPSSTKTLFKPTPIQTTNLDYTEDDDDNHDSLAPKGKRKSTLSPTITLDEPS